MNVLIEQQVAEYEACLPRSDERAEEVDVLHRGAHEKLCALFYPKLLLKRGIDGLKSKSLQKIAKNKPMFHFQSSIHTRNQKRRCGAIKYCYTTTGGKVY
ncbi:hypothetical protein CDAR_518951 [Caerostris darwini]|uniref:Uncharacterized protein n=1 Tax=Caerostris darwini TaxID=1538125 RepID=A0AAV4PPV1_9ARAC|nr:hypothetical protein CDAR_518951 [Caerostris darwini]